MSAIPLHVLSCVAHCEIGWYYCQRKHGQGEKAKGRTAEEGLLLHRRLF
jgi:hypothetical protein